MDYKELHGVFIGTHTELLAKTEELTERQLAYATDTRNLVSGPGMYHKLVGAGVTVDIEVVAVATSNVTIANGLNPGDTVDDVVLANGDAVLLTGQTTGAENGVYVVGTTPARHAAMNEWAEFPKKLVRVLGGTTYANTVWNCTNVSGGTLETTAVTFVQQVKGALQLAGIDQLANIPAITTLAAGDHLLVQQATTGAIRKITAANLKTYATS